jgi:hypothetical protein
VLNRRAALAVVRHQGIGAHGDCDVVAVADLDAEE